MMLLEPIKQKKSSEIVKESILNYIHSNGLRPGARLATDRELVTMLNCSRTVVREALKGLEAVGIIEMKVGKGIFVTEFTLSDLLEKYPPILSDAARDLRCLKEARMAIEIGIIGWVVERATPEDIRRLYGLIEEMEQAEDNEKLVAVDIRFHQALAAIARSPLLAEFSSLLRKFFALSYEAAVRKKMNDPDAMRRMNENTHREHRQLVAAIEARDRDLARKLIEEHLLLPDEQNPSVQH